MSKGKATVVLALIGVALGLVAVKSGRGQTLLAAINGRQVVNRT